MRELTVHDRAGRRIGALTAAIVLTWAAIVVPALVLTATVLRVAPDAPWWPAPVLVLLAVAGADLPDSGVPLVALWFAGGWWVAVVDAPAPLPMLVAALCVAVFHQATAFAAAGPRGRTIEGAVVAGVLRRGSAIGAATAGLWLLAVATSGRLPAGAVPLTVGLVATGVVGWLALSPGLRRRSRRRGPRRGLPGRGTPPG